MSMAERSAKGVALTPEFDRFIRRMVRSGRYRSQSEVVRDALRLMMDREKERDVATDELRRQIAAGVSEAERGETVDGPAFMREWARMEGRARRAKPRTRKRA